MGRPCCLGVVQLRAKLVIAIDPADSKGENLFAAVTVMAPDPAAIGDRPLVWFAWPGGATTDTITICNCRDAAATVKPSFMPAKVRSLLAAIISALAIPRFPMAHSIMPTSRA